MWRVSLARWVAIGAVFVLQAALQAQTTASQLPVSLDHIRAGLAEPAPVLQVPVESGDKPIFRVEVRQANWTLRPVEPEPPVDTTYGLPTVQELLIDGIQKVRAYKHSRTERRAQKEVADALAALCSVRDCAPPRSPQ
jgi:hypothetical protein